jgi:hypothetical protein
MHAGYEKTAGDATAAAEAALLSVLEMEMAVLAEFHAVLAQI